MTMVATGWMLAAVLAGAAPAVDYVPEAATRVHVLSPYMGVLEDPTGTLSLADVSTPAVAALFHRTGGTAPHFGLTDSAYWLRCTLRGGDQDHDWLLELAYAHHDEVDFYVVREDGSVEHREAGALRPFFERDVLHANFLFPLRLHEDEQLTVLLRVHSQSALVLDLNLWPPLAHLQRDHTQQFVNGLYYGFLAAFLLYNLLLWLVVRDRMYLLFVLFMASLGMMELALYGLAYEYLWPDNPWWAKQCIPFSFGAASALAILFTQHFLETRQRAPLLHRALWFCVSFSSVAMVVALLAPYSVAVRVGATAGLSAPLVAFAAAIQGWRKGYAPARTFTVALVVLCLGIAVFTLRALFIVPTNVLTESGLNLGSSLLTMVFTLVLGNRMNAAERDRARAQEEALVAQRQARERVEALNADLERRVAERTAELESMNQELAILDARKDELVATVSHDFRSPLTIIRQNVQTLLRDLNEMDHDDLRGFLEAVQRQETRLTSMCNQLLDLAKLKQRGVDHAPVDLAALVVPLVEGFQVRAQPAGIALAVDVPAGAPVVVRGDSQKLGQVVQNLVDNALRFTPRGGSVRVVLRRLAQPPGQVALEVRDSGCGIPADAVKRIFEPFYQVPRPVTDGHRGSGLGLAIVEEVVKAHGGRVSVDSREGEGTTFTVVLEAAAL